MKQKWTVLAFLCAIFVTYTIDRALLGILAAPIQEDLGISNVRFGVLSAAIFWTYSACVPFSGLAGDRFDRLKIVGLAAVLWSVMAVLTGFASGFWGLIVLGSVAIVAPQTLYGPSANALIAELHHETRTIALSCHQAAYYVGWFVSGVAVAAVLTVFGSWRWAYFVFGSLGLAVGACFLLWGRRHHMASDRSAARRGPTLKESVRAYFGCKTALLVSVCYVAEVFVGYGYSAWGPKFIAQKFSLTAAQAGTGVMFWHYASAFAAILVAGFATDRFVRRFPRFRMALSTGALVVSMPALVLFGTSGSLSVVWSAAALLGAMIGVIGANQVTVIFDVVPSVYRAGAVGFLNVLAGLVGSTAPILLGWLSQIRGIEGFEFGFSAMAAVQLVAVLGLAMAMGVTFRRDALANDR